MRLKQCSLCMLLNHHLGLQVKQSEVWTREKVTSLKTNLNKKSKNLVSQRIQLKAEFILKRLHLQLMLVIAIQMMTQFNTLKILLQVQVLIKFIQQIQSHQRNFTLIVKNHHSESQPKDL